MASLSDLILQQVKSAAGSVDIPSNVQNEVLGGLADSIFGSLKQTAVQPGGIDLIKNLLKGKSDVASSPVTSLATKLFSTNILKKLGLGSVLGAALTGLIPKILGGMSNIYTDKDGDGDVDLNDILLSLAGAGTAKKQTSAGGGLLGAATSILGGLLKKR